VDAEEIQTFFNLKKKNEPNAQDTSVSISITGRPYAVEIFFSAGNFQF